MPAGYQRLSTLDKPQKRAHQASLQQVLQQLQSGQGNIQQSPLFQQGSSFLQSLLSGSPEATAAFEAPFMRQFHEQTIPQLAERFAGLGAQSSSAFNQALGAAGSGLQEQLAALRGNLGLQAADQGLGYAQQPISNLQSFLQTGLGTQSQAYVPKQKPFWQELLTGLSGGAGQALGMLGGGWAGSLFGGNKSQATPG